MSTDHLRAVSARIHESFARQGLMRTMAARLVRIEKGVVEIEVPFSPALTQQNGFFHAAATTAVADTAGGYAALTLMDPEDDVLAVEFKINLLRPAVGDRLVARGQVLKPGRMLSICRIDVFASDRDGASESLVATMTQTCFRARRAGSAGPFPSAD